MRGRFSLLKREKPPRPQKRNPGGFRFSPRTPLKRLKGGGSGPPPLDSTPGATPLQPNLSQSSGSGARQTDCPQPPRLSTAALPAGKQSFNLQSITHSVPTEILIPHRFAPLPQQAKRGPKGTEFATKRPFLLTVNGRFLFGKTKRKWGFNRSAPNRRSLCGSGCRNTPSPSGLKGGPFYGK